jgi:hypothetical protein
MENRMKDNLMCAIDNLLTFEDVGGIDLQADDRAQD